MSSRHPGLHRLVQPPRPARRDHHRQPPHHASRARSSLLPSNPGRLRTGHPNSPAVTETRGGSLRADRSGSTMDKADFYKDALSGVAGPLAGVRVIDVTMAWSGPMASCVLADLGCDVIRVEPPGV